MIILHVANLDSRKSAGPNINTPKNVIYGNKYAQVGLYNLKQADLAINIPKDKYFNIKNYKKIKDLPIPFNNPDIVIFQGMYEIRQCFVARQLRKKKIPYIIVPRCSLTTAAQNNKKIKKKLANMFFFNKFIRKAKYIQFLTQNEYEESKENFRFNNYYILGNGIEMPRKKYKLKNRKEFKIVFVARYNIYHKGLDILLKTIAENYNWFIKNNITLNLYGSDSDNGVQFLKKYIEENKLDSVVLLNGPVFDDEKEKVLLDADLFIHTSRLEGQPTAVIEAISYGIPVIVTPGTNITDIVHENNLGFTCDFNTNSIMMCIKKAYNNRKNFNNISKNERAYSNINFSWDNLTIKLINIIKK